MRWGIGVLLAGLVSLTGCPEPGYFVCSTNADCSEADGGRCEPSGSCSFPDPTCPTGRRYGELGNPANAGLCVPPEDIGSSGLTTAAESSASGSTTGGATGSSTTAAPGESTSTTQAESSSTEPGSTTTTASSSDSSSSSSGVDPILPDVWNDCETSDDCMGFCVEIVNITLDVVGRFCSQECPEPEASCPDPGTGAAPRCTTLFVDDEVVESCVLNCEDTGDDGCPMGMVCALEDQRVGTPRCVHPN